jgi:tetratricopeptide (TPR) repeat protein
MADGLDEDIIIIEDTDAASDVIILDDETKDDSLVSKNKKPLIFIAIGVSLVLIISILTLLLSGDDEEQVQSTNMDFIEQKLDEKIVPTVEPTKIEGMIAKADYLYSTGSKEEALAIYEEIAHYSEAVSAYNLGVAQLKDEQYENALASFIRAIKNNEKRCVSAINAAVCSLHLNKQKSFKYYIDLAYAYLPNERKSPLYSYYYALISYYKQEYLASLSALVNKTTDEYPIIQNDMSAKINALFSNNYDAIENLENNMHKDDDIPDDFNIALLYARVGDLTLAKKYFKSAITKNIEPSKSQLALAYINLKAGQVEEAAKEIDNVTDMFGEEVYKPYPIKVMLKDSLFDYEKAQRRYRSHVLKSKFVKYHKIFYFSPYKIFNLNKTISSIQKGNANIYINNVDSAQAYLEQSTSSSSVNIGIVKAIKKALSFKLREANTILQRLVKIQPKHSILHYNLALTYAQMGDMINAHKHFIRSYNLDSKNYLSGVYAVMSSQLIDKESPKLLEILKDSLSQEQASEKIDLYNTLLFIAQDNFISSVDWLDNNYKVQPLYLAINIIIAIEQNRMDIAKKSALKLTALLPNEILPHMMYIDSHYNELKPKQYARKVMNYLKKQELDFDDLYYGPYITRYLYIQENLFIGKLYYLRKQLKDVLQSTTNEAIDLTAALALASFYDKAFEESFTLYNSLIDDFKIRDSHTLLLGAIASVAAGHHGNATALLELAKLKNKHNLESRYGLGLLYLEMKNNKGAVIQFSRVKKNNFNSEYFNFDIDLQKLLVEKQKITN